MRNMLSQAENLLLFALACIVTKLEQQHVIITIINFRYFSFFVHGSKRLGSRGNMLALRMLPRPK